MRTVKYLFILCFILILQQSLSAQIQTEAIRINQVGFYPNGPKLAIVVEPSAEQFHVTSPDLQDTVFTGNLSSTRYWEYSAENVKQADFTELKNIGTFVVLVPGLGYSAPFDIKPRVHQEVARAATKAFYFQRMSIELTEEFAGQWQRPMGHPDNEVLVHSSAASVERPEGTVLSSPRGWYDAGDYNKYIINSGISVYTLLSIYEHFPEYCMELDTHIPESSNTIPDVLDESLWNIRWMLSMQDPNDGGVYHKCTHANFSGAVMPHQATSPRYVVQKSSTAALNFASVMAQTSRIFREFETELPGFADSCLTAAVDAWNWARKNPDVYYRQNDNNQTYLPQITTGEYGDSNDDDEFKWAAAELFITTLEDSFITAVDPLSDNTTSIPGWNSVETLAFYSLAHHRKNLSAAVDTTALKDRLIQFADQIKDELANSAYQVLLTTFPWGSNAVAANQSMAMIQAFDLTADSTYLDAAIANLDYILGRNATTYCFVSDQGDNPPMHFHHRPSEADDIIAPVPGLLAGGPNPSQQDNCPDYPSDLPARSYLDSWCSYASNEICINWNSPLAYIATAIEAILSSNGKPNTLTINLTSPGDDESFTTSEIISISAEASITDGSIVKVEFYADQIKIDETDNEPFTVQWEDALPGVYEITARAFSESGDFRTSEPVQITVFNSEAVGSVLLVVGSPELNSGDYTVRNILIQNDYHVTIQDDADTVAFHVDDKDVILISSTVASVGNIRSQLININVPLISWEISLFDDYGWTGRKRDTDNGMTSGTSIDIVNDSHPIAAGLSGTVQVTAQEEDLHWGVPNENGVIVATLEGNPDNATIFTYETGDLMYKDMIAKARRIGFCFSDESSTSFTEKGWQFFLQAVMWAKAGERLAVDEEIRIKPSTNQLFMNYPNPFNPETYIHYVLKDPADVSITIYNAMGQTIATLIEKFQYAGNYHVQWDGRDDSGNWVSNGIYFYKMKAGDFLQTRKMVLLK
ncbi:glycoside hydrolase family 9 protein [candidate division KSB1 bacterium]|nr:glycoside hydrolase family 9 protein [candidate division KSB1 bacterium]